jgi:hypothetical protein
MADEKSDKGFSVVDRRVSVDDGSGQEESGKGESRDEAVTQGVEQTKDEDRAEVEPSRIEGTDAGGEEEVSEGVPGEAAQGAAMPVTFPTFILSLHTSALIHLGFIQDPGTNQKTVSLEIARQNIDLLEILKEKTQGNLTEDETKLMDNILYELRMAYLQVSEAAGNKES